MRAPHSAEGKLYDFPRQLVTGFLSRRARQRLPFLLISRRDARKISRALSNNVISGEAEHTRPDESRLRFVCC